jgi:hypothetical protein
MNNKTAFLLLSAVLCACGPDQLKVPDYQACVTDQNCRSGACAYNGGSAICVPQTCRDGIYDGSETDIDCGSGCNIGCNAGKRCSQDYDCKNNRCFSGICVPDSCANNQTDQGEGDVDCGGVCPPCNLGQSCNIDSDCQSTCCQIRFDICVSDTDRDICKQ